MDHFSPISQQFLILLGYSRVPMLSPTRLRDVKLDRSVEKVCKDPGLTSIFSHQQRNGLTPINQGYISGVDIAKLVIYFWGTMLGSFNLIQIGGVCRLKICYNVVCTQSGLRRKAHPRPAERISAKTPSQNCQNFGL